MIQARWLPLEKINDRPDIKPGNCNYLQRDAIPEILNGFFSFLDGETLASCNLVCKQWHDLTDHEPLNDPLWNKAIAREINQCASFVFGKEEWTKYFGDIGNALNYPRDICKILKSNCSFFKGQTVGKTHMFVLVPETVNGESLTLNFFGELVKKPKEGTKTGYDGNRCWQKIFEKHGEITIKKAHWILITNDVIPGSRNKTYTAQKEMMNKHAHYNVPNALDAVLTVFMKCVGSGEFLLGEAPLTYTRCQENVNGYQVVVGGFGPSGLFVNTFILYDNDNIAVLACRRFCPSEVSRS